jgi:hypothetical protein
MKRFCFVLPVLVWLGGCASVHSFHQEPFDTAQKGKVVAHEARHTVWMRFDSDTDWAQNARESFVAQCPTGKIEGVSSRLSTMNNFLHWNYSLRLSGVCVAR